MALTKVTTSGITDNAVNAAKIADGTLAAADLADGAVTSAKLAGSVANAKLANSSITLNGSAVALGASTSLGSLDWQAVVVSDGSTVTTMVAGRGYFVNNSSAAGIVKLPASANRGDTVAIKDYAGNFGTNNLTIQRNSHNIQGVANDSKISTDRASVFMVYIDSTKGWLFTNESNVADLQDKEYVAATGGTVTTSGDFKVHTFTGDSNFVVSAGGNAAGSNSVAYVVIAGGGGGGKNNPASSTGGGGGGAGGYREGKPSGDPYSASPLVAPDGIPVSAQTYPITVGAGSDCSATSGTNSVFSTITSAGGGRGASYQQNYTGSNGGSGGGGAYARAGGSGNTPPVSPPQGSDGAGPSPNSFRAAGGGGGATTAGAGAAPNSGGGGGTGATSSITSTPTARAGGGGGGGGQFGDANGGPSNSGGGTGSAFQSGTNGSNATAATGGGGGGAGGGAASSGGNGGAGVVILRYKFQN